MNRRDILRGIGSTGLVTFGVSTASGSEANTDVEMIEPKGNRRNRIINQAQGDIRTQKLDEELRSEGYEPSQRDTKVSVTKQDGTIHHRTVLIPYEEEIDNSDEKRMVYWTDTEDGEVDIPAVASVTVSNPTEPENAEITIKTPNGEIISQNTQNGDRQPDLEVDRPIQQSSGGCPDPCPCCRDTWECESYNWNCFVFLVGTPAGVIGTCATCLGSLGFNPTCGICEASALGSGFSPDCPLGNNCTTEPACAPPTTY